MLRQWRSLASAAGAVITFGSLALAVQAQAQALSTQAHAPATPRVTVGPLVQVTGPSPLRFCTADDVPGQEAQGSINFPDSEIEPYISVNPRNPRNLVTVWQQDRWSDGGARGLFSAVSDDGGETWKTVTPPRFTLCTGGTFERASDPWVSFASNGDVYFMSLSLDFDPAQFSARNAMQVSKSTDGGHTWGPPTTLIEDNDPNVLNDKNSLTADPTSSDRAYAIWDRLQVFDAGADDIIRLAAEMGRDKVILAGQALRAMRATAVAQETEPIFFIGPTYFTRTINGGATWERPRIIHDPGGNNQTINNLVEVQPDGTVFAMFTEIINEIVGDIVISTFTIALKRSEDHGATFLPRNGVIPAQQIFPVGTFTPDRAQPVRDAALLFDSAVDDRNGTLYLVWQDGRFTGFLFDEIAFSMSRDNGRTWTAPIKINQTPKLAQVFRRAAFVPTIAVNKAGILVATYYDFRNDVAGTQELTDHFAVFCNPASSNCAEAKNWGSERRLTDESFDILNAPVARGHFLGDYMGSESETEDVHPAFGIADGVNEVSVFTRKITIDKRSRE